MALFRLIFEPQRVSDEHRQRLARRAILGGWLSMLAVEGLVVVLVVAAVATPWGAASRLLVGGAAVAVAAAGVFAAGAAWLQRAGRGEVEGAWLLRQVPGWVAVAGGLLVVSRLVRWFGG